MQSDEAGKYLSDDSSFDQLITDLRSTDPSENQQIDSIMEWYRTMSFVGKSKTHYAWSLMKLYLKWDPRYQLLSN